MAALIAYACTLVITTIFLLTDLLLNRRMEKAIFSRRIEMNVPLRCLLILILIYALVYVAVRFVLREGHAIEATGARTRRLEGPLSRDSRLRWDHGRWPLYLAGIIGVVAVASMPAMFQDRAEWPAVWALYALLIPTLILFYRGREVPPPLEIDEPTNVAIDTSQAELPTVTSVLKHLHTHARYRGQLRASVHVPESQATYASPSMSAPWASSFQPGGLLHSALRMLHIDGLGGLWEHQRLALEELLSVSPIGQPRRHVVLATGPGSGRHVTLFLMQLECTLQRGAHVLVITPDEATLEHEYKRFQELAMGTDWQFALYDQVLRKGSRDLPGDPPPELIFCSLQTLHESVLRDTVTWSEFFDGLEVVVAVDIHQYTGILGSNAAQVFRRLQLRMEQHRQTPQYIATARPAENLSTFTSDLFALPSGSNQVIVLEADSAPQPEQVLAVWMPPLDRPADMPGVMATTRVVRQSAFEAAVDLAASLLEIPEYRVLLYTYSWGEDQQHDLVRAINDRVPYVLGRERLRLVSQESDLSMVQRAYDAMLILGAPPHVRDVHWLSGQLGQERRGGFAIVVADHAPEALRMVRTFHALDQQSRGYRQLYNQLPLLVIDWQHPDIVAKHLRCASFESPLRRSQISALFGIPGVQAADHWVQAGEATWEAFARPGMRVLDHALRRHDVDADAAYGLCHLDTLSGDYEQLVEVIDASAVLPIAWIDRYRLPIEAYPGRILRIQGQMLEISSSSLMDGRIIVSPPTRALTTEVIPQYEVAIALDEHESSELPSAARIGGGAPLIIARKRVYVEQSLSRLRERGSRVQDSAPIVVATRQQDTAYAAEALLIMDDPDTEHRLTLTSAHTIAHALRLALRALIPTTGAGHTTGYAGEAQREVMAVPAIATISESPTIVVFDTVEHGLGLAETVRRHASTLLSEAYRIMMSCPCVDGCPACLEAAACHQADSTGACLSLMNKREAMLYLGRALGDRAATVAGYRTPEQIEALRHHAVTDMMDLATIQKQVVDFGLVPLLYGHLPRPLATIRFMNAEEERTLDGVVGYYHPDRVEVVVRPLPEEQLVGLIAHEYAHNWQFSRLPDGTQMMHPNLLTQNHVNFDGRLIAEGFAQWVELRVLDAYGFKGNTESITGRYHDSYGEGYHIIKFLEDRGGVIEVLTLLHGGATEQELATLFIEAGSLGRIRALIAQIDGGQIQVPPPDYSDTPPPAMEVHPVPDAPTHSNDVPTPPSEAPVVGELLEPVQPNVSAPIVSDDVVLAEEALPHARADAPDKFSPPASLAPSDATGERDEVTAFPINDSPSEFSEWHAHQHAVPPPPGAPLSVEAMPGSEPDASPDAEDATTNDDTPAVPRRRRRRSTRTSPA